MEHVRPYAKFLKYLNDGDAWYTETNFNRALLVKYLSTCMLEGHKTASLLQIEELAEADSMSPPNYWNPTSINQHKRISPGGTSTSRARVEWILLRGGRRFA